MSTNISEADIDMKKNLLPGLFLTAFGCLSVAAYAQQETVLHSFHRLAPDPYGRLLLGHHGALVGTAMGGGEFKNGMVFKLVEKQGIWQKHNLVNFDGSNGSDPFSGLVSDSKGALYGTTSLGGAYNNGIVYQITGSNTETVLYSFTGGSDGGRPDGLSFDAATGALYGVTENGGIAYPNDCGVVFELTQSGGTWTETTLHTFNRSDGCTPYTAPQVSSTGILYGTTQAGGPSNFGTVYELADNGGVWSETVLHTFTGGADGAYPHDIDLDRAGDDIYGVTSAGGTTGAGVVFALHQTKRNWQPLVPIYTFGSMPDGMYPYGLIFDQKRDVLYGTTVSGGTEGRGTVFALTRNGTSWSENVLYSFGANAGDGLDPMVGPTEDKVTGNLFGTTSAGGADGGGTVYMIAP